MEFREIATKAKTLAKNFWHDDDQEFCLIVDYKEETFFMDTCSFLRNFEEMIWQGGKDDALGLIECLSLSKIECKVLADDLKD